MASRLAAAGKFSARFAVFRHAAVVSVAAWPGIAAISGYAHKKAHRDTIQLPLKNTANTTKAIVAKAKMPCTRTTGRGKCRSGGTASTLVGSEPGAA